MTPVFCCDIRMAGSEFEALIQSCINTSGCGGVTVGRIFSWHTLAPLVAIKGVKKKNYNLQINFD